jgi:hypothetical protein
MKSDIYSGNSGASSPCGGRLELQGHLLEWKSQVTEALLFLDLQQRQGLEGGEAAKAATGPASLLHDGEKNMLAAKKSTLLYYLTWG